ncbi:hypothetical protein EDB19DRAFT_1739736, partial [Suillus lakei]
WTVMMLGWDLMIMLDNTTTIAEEEIYPSIPSLGAGCLFHVSLPHHNDACSSSVTDLAYCHTGSHAY